MTDLGLRTVHPTAPQRTVWTITLIRERDKVHYTGIQPGTLTRTAAIARHLKKSGGLLPTDHLIATHSVVR